MTVSLDSTSASLIGETAIGADAEPMGMTTVPESVEIGRASGREPLKVSVTVSAAVVAPVSVTVKAPGSLGSAAALSVAAIVTVGGLSSSAIVTVAEFAATMV